MKRKSKCCRLFQSIYGISLITVVVSLFICCDVASNGQNEIEITESLTAAVQKYDKLHQFHCGMAAVCKDRKWGYINAKGEEVIPCQFDSDDNSEDIAECMSFANDFCEDRAVVRKNKKYGVIDKEGNEILPFKYDWIADFSDGLAIVNIGDEQYYINKDGEKAFEMPQVEGSIMYGSFHEGLAYIESFLENKRGYINKEGKITIPMIYNINVSNGCDFSEGKAWVSDSTAIWKCIDTKGNALFTLDAFSVEPFKEGLCAFQVDLWTNSGTWGFVDEKGNVVIDPTHFKFKNMDEPNIGSFVNGINIQGSDIDESTNEESPSYFYDKTGKKILNEYTPDTYARISNGMAAVIKDNMVGFITTTGELIIDYKYDPTPIENTDNLNIFSEGLAVVKIGNVWGYVDKKGNCTISEQDYIKALKATCVQTNHQEQYFTEVDEEENTSYADKEITITLSFDYNHQNGTSSNQYGNYGIHVWKNSGTVSTDIITIPDGKYWQYKGHRCISPGGYRFLQIVEPSQWSKIEFDKGSYKKLNNVDVITKMSGERFFIHWGIFFETAKHELEVYFTEKEMGH